MIRSISIPSKVIKLEEGWCSNTVELKSVTVSRNNPNFISIDDKFIFGKKDENSDDFEVLVFACRDIKEYKIPPNITRIASNAFESSSIRRITFPAQLKEIGKNAFASCDSLRFIEIPGNSELRIIGKNAFKYTKINNIIIPKTVTQICESAFAFCEELRRIEIEQNSSLEAIGNEAFKFSSIESIFIPGSVNTIGTNVFDSCDNLIIVEFENESQYSSTNEQFQDLESHVYVKHFLKHKK